jgi:ATP-dependent Lon protease
MSLVQRLERLTNATPSFRTVIDLYRREALSSVQTSAPMRMAPIILLGPPGIGKTYFANSLANALRIPFASIAMSACDDVGDIVGHSLSWKSARSGLVAKTLLDCGSASPLIVVDEIEKAPHSSHGDRPTDVWHSLFEPENAKDFRDQFLGLAMRADHIFWLATANSLIGIPESVLDRTLVISVKTPSMAESQTIARKVFDAFSRERGGDQRPMTNEQLEFLATYNPRNMKKILLLGAGFAAERGEAQIGMSDLENAQHIVIADERAVQKFGFI